MSEKLHKHTNACYSRIPETEGDGEYLNCGQVAGFPEAAPPQPSCPRCAANEVCITHPDKWMKPSASAEPSEPLDRIDKRNAETDELVAGQEREEAERAELEREWLTQSKWLDYGNWLQAELLKARAAASSHCLSLTPPQDVTSEAKAMFLRIMRTKYSWMHWWVTDCMIAPIVDAMEEWAASRASGTAPNSK